MPKIHSGSLPVRVIVGVLGMMIVALAVIYLFRLTVMFMEFYLYALVVLAIPIVFLIRRATPRESDEIPWYDLLIALVGGGIGIYFALNAQNIFT
ncbi:hypothetical protein ACFLVW_07995, partial [Chloroflexota bacterium]